MEKIIQDMFQNPLAKPRPMQRWAYDQSKDGNNLLIVSSTGSGKTEAAYLASLHWGKTIYALPMTTLASNLYERMNKYERKLSGETWTLQHSNSSNDSWLSNNKAVTTIDQVLSGYLGFGRESLIRGRNVMRSGLILDEVQLFDPESALLTLLNLLESSTKPPFDNQFCIMTATFPTTLRNYLEDNFNISVFIEDEASTKKEVTLNWSEELPVNKIKDIHQKQIIVCNTQKQQIDLVKQLTQAGVDTERLLVLNSRMYPEERQSVEENIDYYFGKSSYENDKILISTQIIEAGMDISADTLYSYEAPIDSLIQREGRTSRWGGAGEFIVIKQEKRNGKHLVYDTELVDNTSRIIKAHLGEQFTWDKQLAWIDEVLNPMYERILRARHQRRFKRKLQKGGTKDLIRDMQSVNIIPIDTYPQIKIEDFNRQSINVPTYLIKDGYIKKGKDIIYKSRIQHGDTVVVDASEWEYDVCGLRKGSGMMPSITTKTEEDTVFQFEDYVEESLYEHLTETAYHMQYIVETEGLIQPSTEDYDVWKIGALHDIGKATKPWQQMIRWNNDGTRAPQDNLYGHRPWAPRSSVGIQNRTHSLIGVLLLDNQLSELERNVIASHHGRLFEVESKMLVTTEWEKQTNHLLTKLGMEPTQLKTQSYLFMGDEFYTPANDEWGLFVYLTGVLMEADRRAINTIRERRNSLILSVD